MARQWQSISLEDAKRHPLYGIKNWLAVYAFGVLLGPLRALGEFSNAAHEAGLTLSQLLNADNSTGAFIKADIAFQVAIATLLLWILFSKHRNFRVATIAVLVLQWPAYVIVLLMAAGPKVPGFAAALTIQFLTSILVLAIWVAYLQRSRRVRVTFENCVLVEKKKASVRQNSRMPLDAAQTTPVGNDAYAAALAEIEEGRLDKGTWARSFAESGGDESKAKALYIKTRAEFISNAEVWMDTQPQALVQESTPKGPSHSDVPKVKVMTSDTKRNTVSSSKSGSSENQFRFGVIVIIMVAGGAWWVYQDSTKRQAVVASPQPNTQTGSGSSQAKDCWWCDAPLAPPEKTSQIERFLDEAPKPVQAPAAQLDLSEFEKAPGKRPTLDTKGWTQESTDSTEVGPWLDFSPPGTRYCRYADRTIQRLYPPGAMPNAKEANPFCLDGSSERVPH